MEVLSGPAAVQLPGTREEERELRSGGLAGSPASLRKCPEEEEGVGGELEGRATHPLLTPTPPTHPRHSVRHLKALVTHSSTPATSGVIQFPRQWGRVKFHLHLHLLRAKGAPLSPIPLRPQPLHQHALFTAMFGCAPPNLHNKQQGVRKMMQTVKMSVSCLG